MIAAWLTARAFGLTRAIWLGLAALALAGSAVWFTAREQADDRANQTIGAAAERESQARKILHNLEKADAAAETVRRDTDAAHAECLRNARNPADC